ncbi:MAG: PDZ domain-containing protein, partial [Gaiella sp.]
TLGGDLIVAIDGTPVSTIAGLRAVLIERQPGETVTLDVVRGGVTKTIRVELGRQPASFTG